MTDTNDNQDNIARVLRASTRGYSCGTHSMHIGPKHDFGAFVKVPIANAVSGVAIGLIYGVEIKDDLLISELVMAESINPNVLRDQRENRMIPVEISVLNIGYRQENNFIHSLPPRPPMSLSQVSLCSAEEVYNFTQKNDYFRLILGAAEVPSDDLLAAAVNYAIWAYPKEERYDFAVNCGRQIARLLSGDMRRLQSILALIRKDRETA
jgi:hypothetical protein